MSENQTRWVKVFNLKNNMRLLDEYDGATVTKINHDKMDIDGRLVEGNIEGYVDEVLRLNHEGEVNGQIPTNSESCGLLIEYYNGFTILIHNAERDKRAMPWTIVVDVLGDGRERYGFWSKDLGLDMYTISTRVTVAFALRYDNVHILTPNGILF